MREIEFLAAGGLKIINYYGTGTYRTNYGNSHFTAMKIIVV